MSRLRDAWERNQGGGGLRCPFCNANNFEVIRTEQNAIGQIRRIRGCKNCGRRVTTVETINAPKPNAGETD